MAVPMEVRNPLPYDAERARRAMLSMQIKADVYEDRADELRDWADEWSRQAADLRAKAIALAERLAKDEGAHIDGSTDAR